MSTRATAAMIVACITPLVAGAETARHTTVTVNPVSGSIEYTEVVADDAGNLRMEMYGADAAGERGAMRDFVVYQAKERMLLATNAGICQSVSMDGDELPGGISSEDIAAARAEMQQIIEELRETDPEAAEELESQMGGMSTMIEGGEAPQITVRRTGETRTIEDYETVGFEISGMPAMNGYRVWAAEIDEVDGARTITAATQGMMQAQKQLMRNMGLGEMMGNNLYNEVLDAMDNYYPIVTEDGRGTTRLVSTSGSGSDDFFPACN